ncbi:MAG TPA: NADPH-dependent FMN reductase [Candidatus Sulfotelmatobacter sp.]|nr:NADPH-dependent FMN reductase [Candidatus Sulfotelmatobacter sp.]
MARTLKIVGICGSLRAGSYNKAALRVAGEVLPPDMTLETAEIGDFPLYNADIQAKGFPAPVERVAAQVKAADGILWVTPEYNFTISGVLKNAIDWLSRMTPQPCDDKPVAVMGAAGGALGTGRAQYELRRICVFLNMHPLNKPEVFIGAAHTKFDASGKLTDEPTREFIKQLMAALDVWTRRFKP